DPPLAKERTNDVTDAVIARVLRWASVAVAVLLAGLTGLVAGHVGLPGDHALSKALQRWAADSSTIRDAAKVIASVLQPDVLDGIGVVGAIALVLNKHRRAAVWIVGVLAVARLGASALKALTHRHRPIFEHPVQIVSGWSFPSGHVATAAAACGCVIVIATMFIRKRGLRRPVIGAAVLVVLLVSLDRLVLGVHYPSDVVGGWLVGGVVTLGGILFFDPRPRSVAYGALPLPEVFPQTDRRLGVVLNPVKIADPGQFRAMVSSMAADSGYSEVLWWETTEEDTGFRMAHEAAVAGASVVLAVGGDGTLRAVCDELAGTGIPVGIVPAGTGNLLARNIGIPLYLRAAVDVGLNGQDRAIDMVRVSGDNMDDATFLVMAGMGFDAAIMAGVNENIKKRVGWLAYVLSALKALMYPAIRLDISVDDGPVTKHRARTVVIGNVGNLQGGMPLMPQARIDDGQIDVVLLNPRRFLSWVPLAARVLTKSPRNDETITRMRGRTVVVRSHSQTPREFDGDVITSGHELRCECVHGRLLVRVPR
ncbi:MAG: diacylglycerol kinase family protein, partial [Marmoricola sp.]